MRADLLTVVTSFFNPCRFASRRRLYNDFAAYVRKAGCRLVTAEAVLGDRPFETPPGPDTLHLRASSFLWHKERLINLGLEHARKTDPSAKYFAWIDSDVQFADPDWAAETVQALQHHDVVQMFGQCSFCDINDEVIWNCPSAFKVFAQKGYHQQPPIATKYIANGHPGLAWAATGDALYRLEGLLDCCISGSGDTLMAWALRGRWDGYLPRDPLTPGYVDAIKQWARRCDMHVRQNIGYVPGTCLHRWHGKAEQRGYDKRWQIISFHRFDPRQDLVIETSVLYKWSGEKPHLENDLRLSLSSRNEDAVA